MSFIFSRNQLIIVLLIAVSMLSLHACKEAPEPVVLEDSVTSLPPSWAKDAIWYQIFVERFNNGDTSNDPTSVNITGAYPGFVPNNWQITPWTQNWYKEDPYFSQMQDQTDFSGNVVTQFDAKTALRRYGGDLQGVIDKLDYIEQLGVNALYFNPLNDAPSSHKYDARSWRHIDVNFGPDPEGDRDIIDDEDPEDPDTWEFTSADMLFLELIKQAKLRGIRIIMDYSWNHTGHTFWAWEDLVEEQRNSAYADWYWVNKFDNPNTEENEFSYEGWFGVHDLPEIKETVYADHSEQVSYTEGDIYNHGAKSHIFYITQRWLDPNGDGKLGDGVDGFRLDVAAELPLGFWRDYRRLVKTINPEAYLVGEIWWQQFPDDLLDPAPVLQGDIFDASMNYRWYRAARQFFAGAPSVVAPSEFIQALQALNQNIQPENNYAMMNMSASHDSPRLLSSMYNSNKYKFKAKASQDAKYKGSKPDEQALVLTKLLLAHQFTYIGAPQIWAGDEMGMWGSDDPHNRKPLTWPNLSFEDETTHPNSIYKTSSKVGFNQALFDFYQSLVTLRKSNRVLIDGSIDFSLSDDKRSLFGYKRENETGQKAFVIFNMKNETQSLILPFDVVAVNGWKLWRSDEAELRNAIPAETILVPGLSALVIITE